MFNFGPLKCGNISVYGGVEDETDFGDITLLDNKPKCKKKFAPFLIGNK